MAIELSDKVFAHSGTPGDLSDWQTLEDHLDATARLAKAVGFALGVPHLAQLAARLHDFGKHDPAFQRRLHGSAETVDHSTAGANLILARASAGPNTWVAELLAHAILGHHAGLPNTSGSAASRNERIGNFRRRDPIPAQITAATTFDLASLVPEVMNKVRREHLGFELSVVGRMVFSCLVDADFRDTEAFYDRLQGRKSDRSWDCLPAILPELRARFEAHLASLPQEGDLNGLRRDILFHVRAQAVLPPGLFTLTVPTGGGKTLASLGFALDHAACHGHRRIITAIPFTSIIDQTAETFRRVLGNVVLEHHSAIDSETTGQEGHDKMRLAMEDWAAPIVVTTNVQLFESLFAARPSRCRKLHNIAGSVIILDEAQSLPRPLLLPVLRMLDTLAALYGCTIVLCTATQPAFDSENLKRGLPLAGRELAPDPGALATRLRRVRIVDGGEMADKGLIAALRQTPQGMVIVNSRRHALDLFRAAAQSGLDGLIHLTTRQYAAHRRRIVEDIRRRLTAGQPCRLIATSLIEAGVDIDFPCGWRAVAGLDSVVQSAGRVNREGRRPHDDSTLTLFRAPHHPPHRQIAPLAAQTHATLRRFGVDRLLEPEAIRDWFGNVYWREGAERMGQPLVDGFKASVTGVDLPYRSTAEAFRMIDSQMVPVIIPRDDAARQAVARLGIAEIASATLARELQTYIVGVGAQARALLVANGHARFHAPDLRADQFCVLETAALYHDDFGLWWERANYLAEEDMII